MNFILHGYCLENGGMYDQTGYWILSFNLTFLVAPILASLQLQIPLIRLLAPTSVTSPNVTIVWCLRYWYRKFNSSKKWRFYHVLSMPPRLLATAPAPPWLVSAASNIVHRPSQLAWPWRCRITVATSLSVLG